MSEIGDAFARIGEHRLRDRIANLAAGALWYCAYYLSSDEPGAQAAQAALRESHRLAWHARLLYAARDMGKRTLGP